MNKTELELAFAAELEKVAIPNQNKRRIIALFVEALAFKEITKRRAKNESV